MESEDVASEEQHTAQHPETSAAPSPIAPFRVQEPRTEADADLGRAESDRPFPGSASKDSMAGIFVVNSDDELGRPSDPKVYSVSRVPLCVVYHY